MIAEGSSNTSPVLSTALHSLEWDGRKIYLLGTAHVSKQSVEDVRLACKEINPDHIAIELCENRFKAIREKEKWKNTDIWKIVREGKTLLLLSQLVLSTFYKKIADDLEVVPGGEMIEGIRLGEEMSIPVSVIDRDVQVTLKRVWGKLGFFRKSKMLVSLLTGWMNTEDVTREKIESMKQNDQLEEIMLEFSSEYPEIKQTLIDERDQYMAEKLKFLKGQTILAVVGAGHVKGIAREMDSEHSLPALETVPPPGMTATILKWGIPLAIVVLLFLVFFKGGKGVAIESVTIWFLVNGILSALGAALALGHPLAVMAAFFAAPITSLNPMIAAGWVSGLVQAWVRKPSVGDFENLPADMAELSKLWKNPVTRVLMVVVFSNLGSAAGTFIATSWIASKII